MTQLRQALVSAGEQLHAAGIDNGPAEARLLAAHQLGISPTDLLFHHDQPAPSGFDDAIARRVQREPLQYITGTAPFGPLELRVGPGVFIPRPETEVLADWAVARLRALSARGTDAPLVVDLCTGSGALAAYISHEVPDARVIGVEISHDALDWAHSNRDHLGTTLGLHYELVEGDACAPNVLSGLHGQVDLVVSNPPYVPDDDNLAPEVYSDPSSAVFAGASGMSVIRSMIPVVASLLREGGAFGIEHDDTTAADVRGEAVAHPDLDAVENLKDLTGRDRFVTGNKRLH